MRLLTRTTLYFLLAMVPLLGLAGYYLFTQFSRELNHRMDDELISNEIHWISYLEKQTAVGSRFILQTPEILIYPVDAPESPYPNITDNQLSDERSNQRLHYRVLSHVVSINGVNYYISIRRSLEQRALLISNITRMMLLVFFGLFVATIIFNWLISRRLWAPFRHSLEKIRRAELHKMEGIRFEASHIKEFNELNTSLNALTSKIHRDYISMKEFTEDAAHEMQTPLAVIQSKIELLIQDDNLTGEQVESLMQASTALNQLSKLNQSLLLLAKIENQQYESSETINLVDVVEKYLKLFGDIIEDKQINVETYFITGFSVRMHPLLADSLVGNLVGNAIKYNAPGGRMIIKTEADAFLISNTSDLPAINQEQLFKRFHKSAGHNNKSVGLGLAIVSKIADTHQLRVSYEMKDGLHQFTIRKP